MNYYLALAFSLCLGQAFCQKPITIGTSQSIQSSVLNETRNLLIYSPAPDKGSKVRYPVLYLLDGPAFFEAYTGMVRYLSACGKMPQLIVVGIANTDRVRDLTPTHATQWSDGENDPAALGTSGGGEAFTRFLADELMPHIDSLYPTAPYRILVGHSLGGLLTLNTLLKHPSLCNAYVTIDPSLWWDHQALLKQVGAELDRADYPTKKLFFASANTLANGMDTSRVEADIVKANGHVRDNLQFRQILAGSKRNQLTYTWKYYPDDNHTSVPFIAGYDAMRALFKGYELPKELTDPELNAAFLGQHYQSVSMMLGYEQLSRKQYPQAYNYFKANVTNYPHSFNVYDSLGDYYLAIGDNSQAATAFRKALSLEENGATRKKLAALSRSATQSK